MKPTLLLAILMVSPLWSQEDRAGHPDSQQLLSAEDQLKLANERIAQLEERIKLMTMQQQGAAQFFQAGQALCELDKREPVKSAPKAPK